MPSQPSQRATPRLVRAFEVRPNSNNERAGFRSAIASENVVRLSGPTTFRPPFRTPIGSENLATVTLRAVH